MNFINQQNSIENLKDLAKLNRHSVLIHGISGCGKTYLAVQYAKLLNIQDFIQIGNAQKNLSVNDVRSMIDQCIQLNNPVVVCIENLDKSKLASSYSLLKFLEEPPSNVYVVITCLNINHIPDTIISRCTTIMVNSPTELDLISYAKHINSDKYNKLSSTTLWKCMKTFSDINVLFNLNDSQLNYFENLKDLCNFKDSVSNIVWKLSHFEDNIELPIEFSIRYIMEICKSYHIQKSGIECISELLQNRISKHTILAKFVFECKYIE